MPGILLSIAIPTYNRAVLLRRCLEQILKQAAPFNTELEVLVSDNDSTDDTELVVRDIQRRGLAITYMKNSENIGAEKNVVTCFEKSAGKYVLVLGDDDLILDGGLLRIMEFLRENEVGVLYLSSYGFTEDYVLERPSRMRSGITIYSDVESYLKRVHYWVTFLSGNVVNKSLFPEGVDPSQHIGTNLPQLGWILSVLFKTNRNAVISDYTVAFKSGNTGGYKLSEVFGKNLCSVFDWFIGKGIPGRYFEIIKKNLVLSFFPNLIIILRAGASKFEFEDDNYFSNLRPVFGNLPYFWIVTVPAIKLPVAMAKIWLKIMIRFDRLLGDKYMKRKITFKSVVCSMLLWPHG